MTPSLAQRVGPYLWNSIPVATTLLLVLVTVMPWRLPGFGPVTPAFTLMAVFYWSLHRPDRLPYGATFALGLIQDLLSGTPLGMTSLVLLLVQAILVAQRRFLFGKSFLVVWWGFMLVAPGAAAIGWIVGSLFFAGALAPMPIVVQVLLTILLYPALTWWFGRIHQAWLRYA